MLLSEPDVGGRISGSWWARAGSGLPCALRRCHAGSQCLDVAQNLRRPTPDTERGHHPHHADVRVGVRSPPTGTTAALPVHHRFAHRRQPPGLTRCPHENNRLQRHGETYCALSLEPQVFLLRCAYAKPNTTPRIKKEKYTLCAEWTMMPIQVLRKRQLGNAYRKTPLTRDARMPQGWWTW
jgi:hypothetical protein